MDGAPPTSAAPFHPGVGQTDRPSFRIAPDTRAPLLLAVARARQAAGVVPRHSQVRAGLPAVPDGKAPGAPRRDVVRRAALVEAEEAIRVQGVVPDAERLDTPPAAR